MRSTPLCVLAALAALGGCAGHRRHEKAEAALTLAPAFSFDASSGASSGEGFDADGGPLGMNLDEARELTVTTTAGSRTYDLSNYSGLQPVNAEGGFAYLSTRDINGNQGVVVLRLSDGSVQALQAVTLAAVGGGRAVLYSPVSNTYSLYDASSGGRTDLSIPGSASVAAIAGDDLLLSPVSRDGSDPDPMYHLIRTDGTKLADYAVPSGATSFVNGINARGAAVGTIVLPSGGQYPVQWSASGEATRLPLLVGYDIQPNSISLSGLIVGMGTHQAGNATATPYVRVAYQGGKLTAFDSPAGTNIYDIRGSANDQGVVVQQGSAAGGNPTVVGFTPHAG